MTPETILRRLLQPLCAKDPPGVRISVRGKELVIISSPVNTPYIVGRDGETLKALRILMAVFGVQVRCSEFSDVHAMSQEPPGDVSVYALTREFIQTWVPGRWLERGDAARAVFTIPQEHYTDERSQALNCWAYKAGKVAADQKIKFKLEPGLVAV